MMKNNVDYVEMGHRVRQLRNNLKLTQEQLAEAVNVSISFIGHIERGEKQCSLDTVCRLAVYLETTVDYLAMGRINQCNQQSCPLYTDLKGLLISYGDR